MMRLVICFLLFANMAAAQTPAASDIRSCKTIEEATARLKCYEELSATTDQELTVKKIFFEVLSSPSAVAAVVAAVLALISGFVGPLVQLSIGKRQAAAAQSSADAAKTSSDAAMLTAQNVGNREIARMRIEWMTKLRDTLSEYHSILMSTEDELLPGQEQKLSQLGTQLDLLLNRDDKIQNELWDVTDRIYRSENLDERQSFDADLIKAGRKVFKARNERRRFPSGRVRTLTSRRDTRGDYSFRTRQTQKFQVSISFRPFGKSKWPIPKKSL
jgi:hypothetical protein